MARQSTASKPLLPLTVKDHAWGCIYTGTRIQIIAAGIIPLKEWPSFSKNQGVFEGYWEIAGRVRKVTVERDYCPTDTEPGEVWVRYTDDERSPHDSVHRAIEQVVRLQTEILEIVKGIEPLPLSALLAIPAEKTPND